MKVVVLSIILDGVGRKGPECFNQTFTFIASLIYIGNESKPRVMFLDPKET
jgi:hypothetical protein